MSSSLSPCSPNGAHRRLRQLDSILGTVAEMFELPGLSVAIADRREILYLRAIGVSDLRTRKALQPQSIFHMASLAKTFTATAMLQLCERGRISLDDRLVMHLPYFEMADERYKAITIRQILSHRSGIPDVRDYQWDRPQHDAGAVERLVRSMRSELLVAMPGERYHYSDLAYDLLADLVAKRSGMSFESYMRRHVLAPLGMEDSSFVASETPHDLRTSPHLGPVPPGPEHIDPPRPPEHPVQIRASDLYPYNRLHAASSTLNSSVLEMTHWIRANLNRGEFAGNRIIGAPSHELLWVSSSDVESILEVESHIGLGWHLGSFRGAFVAGHLGRDPGYWSRLALLPDQGLGFIVAANYDLAPIVLIQNIILNILLDIDPCVPEFLTAAAGKISASNS